MLQLGNTRQLGQERDLLPFLLPFNGKTTTRSRNHGSGPPGAGGLPTRSIYSQLSGGVLY